MNESDASPTKKRSKWARFGDFSRAIAGGSGHPLTFILATVVIIVWAVTGPMFHYNDTWQLVINTGTTIITFLMVFLIQNTQNRDAAAVQLKLDELIRAVEGANNKIISLEDKSLEEIGEIKQEYGEIAKKAAEDAAKNAAEDAIEGAVEGAARGAAAGAVEGTKHAADAA